MDSIRKWFYKPKRDDQSLLAQFFYADEALNLVAAELDSFDGRKDPERCTALVNHLRQCQDKVLTICNRIMDDVIPFDRADRDFRVKFPDDVMQENLAGQLWFGAECLAAGSSIMNREAESAGMRPLAKAVTKALENVRNQLREQCLRGGTSADPERLTESLKILDRLFAEFELCYVSAMVPVKSSQEYELHQLVVVLFSETLHRALQMHLLTQEMIDAYDPALMFTIPRLAIVSGLLVFPDGPLCLDRTPQDMSEMFRPFRTLLQKIRELLWTLNKKELYTLEKLLCSSEEVSPELVSPKNDSEPSNQGIPNPYHVPDLDEFVTRFYIDYPSCKQFVSDFYSSADDGALASWENTDSEDDTEWAGEASECDTIVAGQSVGSGDTEDSIVPSTPSDVVCDSLDANEPVVGQVTPLQETNRRVNPRLDLGLNLESLETNSEGNSTTAMSCLNPSAGFEERRVPSNNESKALTCSDVLSEDDSPIMPDVMDELGLGDDMRSNGSSLLSNPITPLEDGDEEFGDALSSSKSSINAFKLETLELAKLIEELLSHEAVFVPIVERSLEPLEGSSSQLPPNYEMSTLAFAESGPSQTIENLTPSTSSPSSISENIEIRSGFLLANKMAPTVLEESNNLPPSCAESLPDGDCKEAMSVATATLSTLLLSDLPGMSSMSPVSPLDSGLGTVVSCSDGSSLSDRSPDATQPSTANDDSTQVLPQENGQDKSLMQPTRPVHEGTSSLACDSRENSSNLTGNIVSIPCTCSPSKDSKVISVGDVKTRVSDKCICNVERENSNIILSPERETDMENDNTTLPNNNAGSHLINISLDSDITQVSSVLNNVISDNIGANSYEDLTILLDGATVPQHFQKPTSQTIDHEERTTVIEEHLKTRESSVKCLSTRSPTAISSHHKGGHNYNNPDAMPIKAHTYQKDVLKNSSISANSTKVIEGCSKGQFVKGKFYKKSLRGQTSSRFGDDRNYSCNWDSLVKQHSKTSVHRGKNRRRVPNDLNILSNTNESESSYSSTCSSCRSSLTASSLSDSCSVSSETSSFNSECQDDEEIALAMQAAEIANRNEARAKFRSSEDLVHRLFVCVAGVADQLQTNFAGDLRHILKCVFLIHNSTEEEEERLEEEPLEGNTTISTDICRNVESAEEALGWGTTSDSPEVEVPPAWVPDDLAPRCMACESVFTVVRRRHHCRNCGKVFCARCSSNSVALPRYGHSKPVRVCNRCFLYQVTPFTIDQVAAHS